MRKRKNTDSFFLISNHDYYRIFFPKIFSVQNAIRVCPQKSAFGKWLASWPSPYKWDGAAACTGFPFTLLMHFPDKKWIHVPGRKECISTSQCVRNRIVTFPLNPAPPPVQPIFVNGISILPAIQAQNPLVIFASLSPSHAALPPNLSVVNSAFLLSLTSEPSSVLIAAALIRVLIPSGQDCSSNLPNGLSASLKSAFHARFICLQHGFTAS